VRVTIGVERALPGGQCLQKATDVMYIHLPQDESLARIWMTADGLEVLSLPLYPVGRHAIREHCPDIDEDDDNDEEAWR
jgi:hypothetical protein